MNHPSPGQFADFLFDGGLVANIVPTSGPAAEHFIDFAKSDLDAGSDERYNLNAVANAKRAIHLRVDRLLQAYGGLTKRYPRGSSLTLKSGFPMKFDYLESCAVLTPQIVRKLNRFRNVAEHEYRLPTREEALDYVDVADLFVRSSGVFMSRFPCMLRLRSTEQNLQGAARQKLRIDFPPEKGSILIKLHRCDADDQMIHEKVEQALESTKDHRRRIALSVEALRQHHRSFYEAALEEYGHLTEYRVMVNDEGGVFEDWIQFLVSNCPIGKCGNQEYQMRVPDDCQSSVVASG